VYRRLEFKDFPDFIGIVLDLANANRVLSENALRP
jgi:hypothetical protein